MKIITGTTGSPHITPLQDSMWHRALTVVDSCVLNFGNNFEPQIMTNNLVRVKSGICSLQGRFMCIEPNTYDEVTIDNGSQGMQRIDIICGKITIDNQGKSTATLEVVKGTPAASNPQPPTIPTGNLDDDDTEAYIPLVQITLNGINLTTATMIGDVYKHSVKKLLWENASPDSQFAEQTLTIEGLSNYNKLEIEYRTANPIHESGGLTLYAKISTTKPSRIESSGFIGGADVRSRACNVYRKISPSTSAIHFYSANRTLIASDATFSTVVDNAACVPLAIYGIKEG